MITGTVTASREAVIQLEVVGPSGATRWIQAVIDTGYNGWLTLPAAVIAALQLPFVGHRRGTLADGAVVLLDVFFGCVVWHGTRQEILISQADGAPLAGMSLLWGSRVTIDAADGGPVVIHEMP
jgi:clan AA aspartic protease